MHADEGTPPRLPGSVIRGGQGGGSGDGRRMLTPLKRASLPSRAHALAGVARYRRFCSPPCRARSSRSTVRARCALSTRRPSSFSAPAPPRWSASKLAELLLPHSPVLALADAVWRTGGSIAEYDVPLEGPRVPPRSVTIQGALAGEGADLLVLMLHERSMADKMDRQLTHRNAARSVTAMAAMLAHEVKNPLSGIRGAAQLLEQDADPAGARADPADLRRDRPHRRAGRPHGGVFRSRARSAAARSTSTRCSIGCARSAQSGFARHVAIREEYDPSLPPVHGDRDLLLQVFLNLVKNAAEAVPAVGGEIVLDHRLSARSAPRRAGRRGAPAPAADGLGRR